jgi:hypothetical protein
MNQITEHVSDDLKSILEANRQKYPEIGQVKLYEKTAEQLSAMANKIPAWSRSYVQAVAVGTVPPGRRFAEAVVKVKQDLSNAPMDEPQIALARLMEVLGTGPISTDRFITCMEILIGLQRQKEN